jgi:hypothetical protein
VSSVDKVETLKTVRGKDIKLRYTQDNLEDALINQRQYFDEDSNQLTPVTPLLLARQVPTSNPTIDRLGKSDPRYISACFGSPTNLSGQSEYKVLIPYAPGDANQVEQIKEIRDYVSSSSFLIPQLPLALTYQGENHIA